MNIKPGNKASIDRQLKKNRNRLLKNYNPTIGRMELLSKFVIKTTNQIKYRDIKEWKAPITKLCPTCYSKDTRTLIKNYYKQCKECYKKNI